MTTAPIGVFDSGVEGLTVAGAILDQRLHEPLLDSGDTVNRSHGPRPLADVRPLSLEVMDGIDVRGVKVLVIACDAAGAACLRFHGPEIGKLPGASGASA